MIKTLFLLGFLPNPRMQKRINNAKQNSSVHLVCWDRGKEMLAPPSIEGITCRIIKEAAGNDPVSRLIPFRRFSKQALSELCNIKPDIIHVQGLDMLQIACDYKRKQNKEVHIIYEVADLHRLLVDRQKGLVRKAAQRLLLRSERKCSKYADLLVLTSSKYFDTYFSRFYNEEKVFFFPNIPDLSVFQDYRKKETHKHFVVGYFGVIRYKEELKLLINSLSTTKSNLIIAGYEENDPEIENLCKGRDDIEWIGRYDFKKSAAELYGRCDCIFAVYDAGMLNCRVALPNKLYEAVYCELPILVADNTYVGELVNEWGVGIPVVHDSQESIEKALLAFQDEAQYNKYVIECQKHKDYINLEKMNEKYNSFVKKNLRISEVID